MSSTNRERRRFRPTFDTRLEDKHLLSTGLNPIAPVPVSAGAIHSEVAKVRTTYLQQVQAATASLKSAVQADVVQVYASGSAPTSRQLTDFESKLAGEVDATAFRLASQVSLLPVSGTLFLPAIETALLAPDGSLADRLTGFAASSSYNTSAATLEPVLMQQINRSTTQLSAQISTFLNTRHLNRQSVTSAGRRISLEQYMSRQLVSQTADTFGMLSQSFPGTASSVLFPNGTATSPTQQVLAQFGVQVQNALSTAQFQLASGLALFSGSSAVDQQIQSELFGSTTNASSLSSALQNIDFGAADFSSTAAAAFDTSFLNVSTPLNTFLGLTNQPIASLPTSDFTSPFVTDFAGSTFNSGFNNGFATDGSSGFIGFGVTPTSFNTNYGTGFDSLVTSTSGLGGTTVS